MYVGSEAKVKLTQHCIPWIWKTRNCYTGRVQCV